MSAPDRHGARVDETLRGRPDGRNQVLRPFAFRQVRERTQVDAFERGGVVDVLGVHDDASAAVHQPAELAEFGVPRDELQVETATSAFAPGPVQTSESRIPASTSSIGGTACSHQNRTPAAIATWSSITAVMVLDAIESAAIRPRSRYHRVAAERIDEHPWRRRSGNVDLAAVCDDVDRHQIRVTDNRDTRP
jgi:hypothetical protein